MKIIWLLAGVILVEHAVSVSCQRYSLDDLLMKNIKQPESRVFAAPIANKRDWRSSGSPINSYSYSKLVPEDYPDDEMSRESELSSYDRQHNSGEFVTRNGEGGKDFFQELRNILFDKPGNSVTPK